MSTKSLTGVTNPSMPPIPTRLGRYDIVERLATGGMAEIFLACERGVHGLERTVVVKRILPHLAIHENFVEMFLQEARIVARLNHPNIVKIYELGEDEGNFYIAMEYVPGCSLRDLMRKAAVNHIDIPVDVVCSLVRQAAAGAHVAHELTGSDGLSLGLVHRDISPHNLMVTRTGHVKLLDFGIAKATEEASSNTRTGVLKGKVHYMSPEQCQQDSLDRRSDEFALGIVFWELLTARRLFKRESELMSMQAIVSGETWPVHQFRTELPDAVAFVVEKTLSTERDERYDTCEKLRHAIDEASETCHLKLGPDTIAPFVTEIMGKSIDLAEEAHKDAIDRTLTLGMADTAILDDPTIVEGITRRPKKREITQTGGSIPSLPGLPAASAATDKISATSPKTTRLPQKLLFLVVFLLFATATFFTHEFLQKPSVSGPAIRVGFAPIFEPRILLDDMEGLRLYLERKTGRPIEFLVAKNYRSLSEHLLDGDVHFASLPPLLFVKTRRKNSSVLPIAIKLIDGSAGSDAMLLMREGLTAKNATELKGLTICYTDLDSTTGYALPRDYLRTHGIDPDTDLKSRFTKNHSQTLRDLIEGKCDIGGTYSGAYLSAQSTGIRVSRLRQFGITGRVPQDTIVAAPGVDAKDVTLMADAFLEFDVQKELGRATVGSLERLSGYQNPDIGGFNDVERLFDPN
ncbi:MAG: PhnD/SsuA/transferrin family substrate-binding protein [Deltaproteobacteria bacterium]|nr:PhnD/SsuA/transferrin family substrate-binding protein [Deltaproteobacteria bacterium]